MDNELQECSNVGIQECRELKDGRRKSAMRIQRKRLVRLFALQVYRTLYWSLNLKYSVQVKDAPIHKTLSTEY